MALTYEASATLMGDLPFRGRIKVAALHLAAYIQGEPADVPAHATRKRWSDGCFQNAEQVAFLIQPGVVMDDRVQASGAEVSDTDLQAAVEKIITTLLI